MLILSAQSIFADDCFDDIGPPLYGFVAEVTTVDDQVCDMNPKSTNPCFTSEQIGGENDLRNFDERQGNNGFRAGRRQCRFTSGAG